jgi:signal peptidase I
MYSYKRKDTIMDKFPIIGKLLLRVGISLLLAFILSFLFSRFWFFPYKIQDSSMLPRYSKGDSIWFSHFTNHLEYEDLVMARAGQSEQVFLGRIKGIPGDRVYIQKKKFFRNGKELKEPSLVWEDKRNPFPSKLSNRDYYAETRLGPGEYFVLCDNRDSCLDSREFGPIKKDKILAKKM